VLWNNNNDYFML